MGKKYTKIEIIDFILDTVQEQGYIVPYDLVRKLGMIHNTARSYLFSFADDTKAIKSEVRYKCKDGRVMRKWVLNNELE